MTFDIIGNIKCRETSHNKGELRYEAITVDAIHRCTYDLCQNFHLNGLIHWSITYYEQFIAKMTDKVS